MATQQLGGGFLPALEARMKSFVQAVSSGDAEALASHQAQFANPRLKSKNLNNLNLLNNNSHVNLNPTPPSRTNTYPVENNLNNLNPYEKKNKSGLTRLQLLTDETLKRLLSWGVEEWLIYVCVAEYGLYTVKGQANRIHCIPDGYFKPHYGPIEKQKGRFFNKEMQKLKEQKAAGQRQAV